MEDRLPSEVEDSVIASLEITTDAPCPQDFDGAPASAPASAPKATSALTPEQCSAVLECALRLYAPGPPLPEPWQEVPISDDCRSINLPSSEVEHQLRANYSEELLLAAGLLVEVGDARQLNPRLDCQAGTLVLGVRDPSGHFVVDLITTRGVLSGTALPLDVVIWPDGRRRSASAGDASPPGTPDNFDDAGPGDSSMIYATTSMLEAVLLHSLALPVVLFRGFGMLKHSQWKDLDENYWQLTPTAVAGCRPLLNAGPHTSDSPAPAADFETSTAPADDDPTGDDSADPVATSSPQDTDTDADESPALLFVGWDLLNARKLVPTRVRLVLEYVHDTAEAVKCDTDDWVIVVPAPDDTSDLDELRRLLRLRSARAVHGWLAAQTEGLVAPTISCAVHDYRGKRTSVAPAPGTNAPSQHPASPPPSLYEAREKLVQMLQAHDGHEHTSAYYRSFIDTYMRAVELECVEPIRERADGERNPVIAEVYRELADAVRRVRALEPIRDARRIPNILRSDLGLEKESVEDLYDKRRDKMEKLITTLTKLMKR